MVIKEEQLAAYVVDWLKLQDWDVYQEVEIFGRICDIVAVRSAVTWTIECKTCLSLKVLDQAWFWMMYANFSSVAVPAPKRRREIPLLYKILSDYGIGLIHVDPLPSTWTPGNFVMQQRGPALNRHISSKLSASLLPEQRDWAPAGNSAGKRYTPFQGTKRALQEMINQDGPMTLRMVVERLEHHYISDTTAKRCLRDLIERGVIEGVKIRREGRFIWVDPE